MATEIRHIEETTGTRSVLQASLDNAQMAIETDGNKNISYKDSTGTFHTIANLTDIEDFPVNLADLTEKNHSSLTDRDHDGNHARLSPASDGVDAVRITDSADDNTIVSIDTTNKRVGIGTNAPTVDFEVIGNVVLDGTVEINKEKDNNVFKVKGATSDYLIKTNPIEGAESVGILSEPIAGNALTVGGCTKVDGVFTATDNSILYKGLLVNSTRNNATSFTVYKETTGNALSVFPTGKIAINSATGADGPINELLVNGSIKATTTIEATGTILGSNVFEPIYASIYNLYTPISLSLTSGYPKLGMFAGGYGAAGVYSSDITPDYNNSKITVAKTGVYKITASYTVIVPSAEYSFNSAFYIDGSILSCSEVHIKVPVATKGVLVTLSAIATIDCSGSSKEVDIRKESSTNSYQLSYPHLEIYRIA